MAICNWSGIIKILEKIYHLTTVRSWRWKIDSNEIVGDHALNHKSVANYILLDSFIWDSQTTEAEALCNWIRSSETLPETSNKNSTELHSKQQVKQQVKQQFDLGGLRPERETWYTSAKRELKKKKKKTCILNWPLPIGAFQDQYRQTMINIYSNKHSLKNPNWRETDQLAIYKRCREVELGATENNIS